MMLTYCKVCHKDIFITTTLFGVRENNKHPDGGIVCESCHWDISEEKKIRDKRNKTIDVLFKEKKWYQLFKK